MQPDFDLARAEFDNQTSVLVTLLAIIDATAQGTGAEQVPAVPPGGQNTMAAAAIVLLAAHFEEYIRQQIQEYAGHMILEYQHLTDVERERFMDSYWRGGTGKLGRIRPKGDPLWMTSAERHLRSLLAFPIDGQLTDFSAVLLSEHENNMRWDTITELTGRIGVRKLSDSMFACENLRNNLSAGKRDDFSEVIQRRLNEFYQMRNGIVHSISQAAGIGSSVFQQWVEFLKLVAIAFSQSLVAAFSQFADDVRKRKERATRATASNA